jgi:hypothetical protein
LLEASRKIKIKIKIKKINCSIEQGALINLDYETASLKKLQLRGKQPYRRKTAGYKEALGENETAG